MDEIWFGIGVIYLTRCGQRHQFVTGLSWTNRHCREWFGEQARRDESSAKQQQVDI